MSSSAHDEDGLRRLLLGTLSESEREALEARLLAEEELFALASEVEDEVAGAYAARTLAHAERAAFEAQLALVPRLQERVRAARALDRAAARAAPAPPSLWRRTLDRLRPGRGVWQWSLAGGLAGALLVGVLVRPQLAVLQDESASLRRERDAALTEAARLTHAAQTRARRAAQTFALAPGVSRSDLGPARLQLAPRAGVVVFHLDLERPLPGPLRVVLENASGQQVFARDGLRATGQGGYAYVEVDVEAELLAPGLHTFRLAMLAHGQAPGAARYAFELVQKR